MKHDDAASLERLARWVGTEPAALDIVALQRYRDWLVGEALAAGGIGPDETPRVWNRHILDSLSFIKAVSSSTRTVIDIGSGVGLPGIPLAIAQPEWQVTLVDRSERRAWLARRALRILGLDNCKAVVDDSATMAPTDADVVVSRASMPLPQLVNHARRIAPGADLVVGWSRAAAPPADAVGDLTIEVPASVLGDPAWLVKIGL